MNPRGLELFIAMGALALAGVFAWTLTEFHLTMVVLLIGGALFAVFASLMRETYLPLLLMLTLALGSSYSTDLAAQSFYLRFFILAVVASRGVMLFLRRSAEGDRPPAQPSTFLHWTFFYVVLTNLISSIYSMDPALTFKRGLTLLLLYFVIFVYFWFRAVSPRECEEHATTFVKGTATLLAIGLFCLAIGLPGMFREHRLRLIFGNPNQLGHFCALMLPIVVWLVFEGKTRRLYAWSILGMVVACLLWSGSRGGLLAATFGTFIVIALSYRRYLYYAAAALLVVGSLQSLFGDSRRSLHDTGFVEEDVLRERTLQTASGRTEVWKISLSLIAKHPLLGYGYGTTDRMFQQGYFPDVESFQGGNLHNSYLEALLGSGWIGSIPLFLSLLALILLGRVFWLPSEVTHNFRLTSMFYAVAVTGVVSAIVESWLLSVGSVFCFPFWLSCALFLKMARHFVDWRAPMKV